jgi:glycerol kinase
VGAAFSSRSQRLFAPHWIDGAKGSIFGITQPTAKGHIARATLEATCFQTQATLDAMEVESNQQLAELSVDSGMSHADLSPSTVDPPPPSAYP